MSPELGHLLNALWEKQTCEPQELPAAKARLEKLIDQVLSRRQGLSREALFMLS